MLEDTREKEKSPRVGKCIHGLSGSREHTSWDAMIQRCTNPNNPAYDNYGGRGIKVCDRWLESFENFYEDMEERPDGTSLDRVDVNGDYCPENCRWCDRGEQNFNGRRRKNNTSGKTGVSFYTKHNKWCARINYKGKNISLGMFHSLCDAIKAREDAEIRYYGYIKE